MTIIRDNKASMLQAVKHLLNQGRWGEATQLYRDYTGDSVEEAFDMLIAVDETGRWATAKVTSSTAVCHATVTQSGVDLSSCNLSGYKGHDCWNPDTM